MRLFVYFCRKDVFAQRQKEMNKSISAMTQFVEEIMVSEPVMQIVQYICCAVFSQHLLGEDCFAG